MTPPRLQKSTLIIAIVAIAVAVLLEVPGRVVSGDGGSEPSMVFEHGWPWAHLRRETVERHTPPEYTSPEGLSLVPCFLPAIHPLDTRTELPNWSVPWLTAANWRFWQADIESDPPRWSFDGATMACDIAASLIIATMIVLAWEIRRRRRPNIFSFGLADMFLAVALVCGALGWWAHAKRDYQREHQYARVNSLDPTIGWFPDGEECVAPLWVQSLLGPQIIPTFFWRTRILQIWAEDVDDTDKLTNAISLFPYVTHVDVYNPDSKPFPYSALQVIRRLETLELQGGETIDKHNFNELAKLTKLRKLIVDDKSRIPLQLLSRLHSALPDCKVVDFGDDW